MLFRHLVASAAVLFAVAPGAAAEAQLRLFEPGRISTVEADELTSTFSPDGPIVVPGRDAEPIGFLSPGTGKSLHGSLLPGRVGRPSLR